MSWETEKGVEYRNEYSRNKYDRFSVMLPKGKKAEYMQFAAEQGQSLNAVINQLLKDWLDNLTANNN
jgi:predicted HicB family RNase H-like nuclease